MSILDFIRDRSRYYNCLVCGKSLKDCDVRMLGHAGNRYTIQVTCGSCHVSFVLILLVEGRNIRAELKEQKPAPVARVIPADPIEADEVLDLHQILHSHQGSLTDLLRPPATKNPKR